MIRIGDVILDMTKGRECLPEKIAKMLSIDAEDILSLRIKKESVDARKKSDIRFVYTVDIKLSDENEKGVLRRFSGIKRVEEQVYSRPHPGSERMLWRPVVVGLGPCGIFAALTLAEAGYRPIVLERGYPVDERALHVGRFWERGELREESNALFGEGGAGAFSDGKLVTQIKDVRIEHVLGTLVKAGAPPEILYEQKPHVGTDLLCDTVKNIRNMILDSGGEIRFNSKLTEIETDGSGTLCAVTYRDDRGDSVRLEASVLVLAIGHSARDTVKALHEAGLYMEQKPFSIGLRIEHKRDMIDRSQYGGYAGHPRLKAAQYMLSHRCSGGRGVYTFCMCPGGQVIAAASEPGYLVTNGMSHHERMGKNSNSAILVDVRTTDFESEHPLAGIEFQRKWEKKAFILGGGDYLAPAQRLGDFMGESGTKGSKEHCDESECAGDERIAPTYRPGVKWTEVKNCLPAFATSALREAMPVFGKKLRGFDDPDAVLTAVESRSSSPVRIRRDETLQGSIRGIYPSGEGAGFAGGITSAAIDGIKTAEKIIERFAQPRENMIQ